MFIDGVINLYFSHYPQRGCLTALATVDLIIWYFVIIDLHYFFHAHPCQFETITRCWCTQNLPFFCMVTQFNLIFKLCWYPQKELSRSENLLNCFHAVGNRFFSLRFFQFILHFVYRSSLKNKPSQIVAKSSTHTHPRNGSFNSVFFSHRYSSIRNQ